MILVTKLRDCTSQSKKSMKTPKSDSDGFMAFSLFVIFLLKEVCDAFSVSPTTH